MIKMDNQKTRLMILFFFYYLMVSNIIFLISSNRNSAFHPKNDFTINLCTSTNTKWNLTGSIMDGEGRYIATILIDDLDPEFTWEITAAKYEWCSGNGTIEDPYVIESVYIDGQMIAGSGDFEYFFYCCIWIRNSIKHFVIRDCVLERTGVGEGCAGIKLENVTNALVTDNECKFNQIGISVYQSQCENMILQRNFITTDNTILEDDNATYVYGMGFGISVFESNNVNIRYNNFTNAGHAVHIREGRDHVISNNFFINTKELRTSMLFFLFKCNSSIFEYNDVISFDIENDIFERDCYDNTFEGNTINGETLSLLSSTEEEDQQIQLDSCIENIFINNRFFTDYQQYLQFLNGSDVWVGMIIGMGIVGACVCALAVIILRRKK